MENHSFNEIEPTIEILDKEGNNINYDSKKYKKKSLFYNNSFLSKVIKTLLMILSTILIFIITPFYIVISTITAVFLLLTFLIFLGIAFIISKFKRR